jgi:hypothetical protein
MNLVQYEMKDEQPLNPRLVKIGLIPTGTEQKKRTDKLTNADNESEKREEFLNEYVRDLEEMMFMTHHKVRQPVANIIGMANLIDKYANSPRELKKIAEYMKQSALDLDAFTQELTAFIKNLEQKGKNKGK